ncbi:hypothetical protein GCM10007907_16790 [Chitinimonas prasina]|uniref:Uncharacterized protein n=1 Tax=Chitinimonas prasina TaxID=1434937 RepID=A0ABQ5YG44_9NEIS|nr:hypothetical protein [Chitinimonas prasina]GLR12889.1 hypothetical protein GCM10007907_16790 [Chitinimonas prasina]
MPAVDAQTPRQASNTNVFVKITPAMRDAANALAVALDLTEERALAALVEALGEAH